MQQLILIGLGGALGAITRYGVTVGATRVFGHGFPVGTLLVNVAGSFAMGVLIGWLASRSVGDQSLRLFFATGFLGAFTTFSAFSLDFATLVERGQMVSAVSYAAVGVIASIVALFIGLGIARAVI
ncbi:MAG: fluoride efflux transporter CrcB [Pseudomonadota bacterium]